MLERCSQNYECGTPLPLFKSLCQYMAGFDLDPCASKENHKCHNYYTIKDNGLEQEWYGKVYMNPPYGLEIPKWMEKANREVGRGCKVVALIPGRVDTNWFHQYVLYSKYLSELWFVKGRIKFEGFEGSPMFPSIIIILEQDRSN